MPPTMSQKQKSVMKLFQYNLVLRLSRFVAEAWYPFWDDGDVDEFPQLVIPFLLAIAFLLHPIDLWLW